MAENFSKTLKENGLSDKQKNDILHQIIDDWGNRFREEDGLIEKLKKEAEEKKRQEDNIVTP